MDIPILGLIIVGLVVGAIARFVLLLVIRAIASRRRYAWRRW